MIILPFKVHRVYHCTEFIAPAPSQEEMPLFVKALYTGKKGADAHHCNRGSRSTLLIIQPHADPFIFTNT